MAAHSGVSTPRAGTSQRTPAYPAGSRYQRSLSPRRPAASAGSSSSTATRSRAGSAPYPSGRKAHPAGAAAPAGERGG